MANAEVKITIEPFPDAYIAPTGGGTASLKSLLPYDMTETNDPANRVAVRRPTGNGTAQPGNPPTLYVEGGITISGNGATKLNLSVVDNAIKPATYTVCGVVFNITAAGMAYREQRAADALVSGVAPGRDNFTDFTCDSNGKVILNDADVLAGTTHYEFLLLIQNDIGGMAIVDPQITNSN